MLEGVEKVIEGVRKQSDFTAIQKGKKEPLRILSDGMEFGKLF